jgi:hypothetical protein
MAVLSGYVTAGRRDVVSRRSPRGGGVVQGRETGDDGEPEAQATSGANSPAASRSAPPALVSVLQIGSIIGGTSFGLVGFGHHDVDRTVANTKRFRVSA